MRKTTNRNNRAGSAFRSVSRGRVIALWAFIVAAGLVFGAVQNTAAKDDLAETAREQQMSRDAEIGSRMFEYPTEKRKLLKPSILSLGAIKPLFMGVDDVAIPAFLVDPTDASADPAFTGTQIWGAAYDSTNNKVYFNNGGVLWEWPVGGTPTSLGTIVDGTGATQSMVSLAWHNGVLYGTKNIATEAIWQIDTSTRVATILITYPTTHDMGGLAVDPNTGFFYATDDGSTDSLVRINNDGTVTPIAPYPTGETDIDALAISNDGKAYLVVDEPGLVYVYDLVAGAYLPPFANPWTTSEIFSGATWIQSTPSGMATITGKAMMPTGTVLGNVMVYISDGAGFNAMARTSPFGTFRFENIPMGVTYTITGVKKQYSFTPMDVPVMSDITGVELVADP